MRLGRSEYFGCALVVQSTRRSEYFSIMVFPSLRILRSWKSIGKGLPISPHLDAVQEFIVSISDFVSDSSLLRLLQILLRLKFGRLLTLLVVA